MHFVCALLDMNGNEVFKLTRLRALLYQRLHQNPYLEEKNCRKYFAAICYLNELKFNYFTLQNFDSILEINVS